MQGRYDEIKELLAEGHAIEALDCADRELRKSNDATLQYLKGTAHMKLGEYGQAMTAFLRSRELQPDGPGAQALPMLTDIMDFYHKDLYNP